MLKRSAQFGPQILVPMLTVLLVIGCGKARPAHPKNQNSHVSGSLSSASSTAVPLGQEMEIRLVASSGESTHDFDPYMEGETVVFQRPVPFLNQEFNFEWTDHLNGSLISQSDYRYFLRLYNGQILQLVRPTRAYHDRSSGKWKIPLSEIREALLSRAGNETHPTRFHIIQIEAMTADRQIHLRILFKLQTSNESES